MRIVSRRLMIFWRQGPGMRRSRRCLTRCARRFGGLGGRPLRPAKWTGDGEARGGRRWLIPSSPSFVLPPSDEGGGKPEGFDGGRDMASLEKAECPEQIDCEFSPSVACGDSSPLRGSQGAGTGSLFRRRGGGFNIDRFRLQQCILQQCCRRGGKRDPLKLIQRPANCCTQKEIHFCIVRHKNRPLSFC